MNIIPTALIQTADIVDAIMARSALRGDTTGRGSLLGDNDTEAIERVLRSQVPRALQTLGLSWTASPTGWAVDIPPTCGPLLIEYILDRFEQGPGALQPYLGNVTPIQPYI